MTKKAKVGIQSEYGVKDEQKTIWVFLEQTQGELAGVSLELLAKGRSLADEAGCKLIGLLLGYQVNALIELAIAHGAEEIWAADHPLLEWFDVDTYTKTAYEAILKGKPSIFLAGATPNGRDLAGRLAVRLKTGLTADCTELRINPISGLLSSEVTGFGGGVLAIIDSPKHRPQMATVRPGVFPPHEPVSDRQGSRIDLKVELSEDMLRNKLLERVIGEGVDLTATPALVIGGRGIEGEFEMLAALAECVDGEIGATRPPVDDGYIERERQIGQTGIICRPKVAIVCGVSGAFQFVVGIQDADVVIAINSDPDAAIFEFADYCIVGDALEIVPALTQKLLTPEMVPHA